MFKFHNMIPFLMISLLGLSGCGRGFSVIHRETSSLADGRTQVRYSLLNYHKPSKTKSRQGPFIRIFNENYLEEETSGFFLLWTNTLLGQAGTVTADLDVLAQQLDYSITAYKNNLTSFTATTSRISSEVAPEYQKFLTELDKLEGAFAPPTATSNEITSKTLQNSNNTGA